MAGSASATTWSSLRWLSWRTPMGVGEGQSDQVGQRGRDVGLGDFQGVGEPRFAYTSFVTDLFARKIVGWAGRRSPAC